MWRAYWLARSSHAIPQMQQEHMTTLIDRLKNPELHYPGNFDTPARANAVLMSLCQEAADALAAPAVPDMLTIHDPETSDYKEGWNECREFILTEMRKI